MFETVPVERVRLADIPPSATAKQFTCEHSWRMGRVYDRSSVAHGCRHCGLKMYVEVDADGRMIPDTGHIVYADAAGVED